MNKIKLVLISFIMLALGFQVNAQKKGKADKLATELNLTSAQSTSLEAIKKNYRPKIKAIKENTSLTEEQKKAQIKPLKEAKQTEIKALLTPDQLAKYEEIKDNKKANKGAKADKLKEELGLTDSQSTKMTAINKKYKESISSVKADNSLAEKKKKSKIKSLRASKTNEIKGVLTADQFTKYKELKANKKKKNKKKK